MTVKTYSLKRDGYKVLGKNFQVRNFACKDGSDKILIDDLLITYLQAIRDHFGKPLSVSSAYRTLSYNRRIGSGDGSLHVQGRACDFYVSGVAPLELAKYAEGLGIKGIGYYPPGDGSFCHIDTRTSKYFWIKKNGQEIGISTHGYKEEEVEIKEIQIKHSEKGIVKIKSVNVNGENYVRLRDTELIAPVEVGWDGTYPTVKVNYKV